MSWLWVFFFLNAKVWSATVCPPQVSEAAELRPYFTWAEFSREWQGSVTSAFWEAGSLGGESFRKPLAAPYLKSYQERDSRILELEAWGFSFDYLAQSRVMIPSLPDIVTRITQQHSDWVSRGRIRRDQLLIPGVALRNKRGKIVVAPYGTETPESEIVDVGMNPSLFTKIIHLGVVPISSGIRAIHDLNHLRGLNAEPRFMSELRSLAELFLSGQSGLPLRDRYVRFFHLYEGLALFPPGKRDELQRHLTFSGEPSRRELFKFLSEQSPQKTLERAEALVLFANANLMFFGGAGEIGVPYSNLELLDSVPRLLVQTAREIEAYRTPKENQSIKSRYRRLCESLSRLESALWYSTQITIEEYFAALRLRVVPENSLLRRWFNSAEISTPNKPAIFSLSLEGKLEASHETSFSPHYTVHQD